MMNWLHSNIPLLSWDVSDPALQALLVSNLKEGKGNCNTVPAEMVLWWQVERSMCKLVSLTQTQAPYMAQPTGTPILGASQLELAGFSNSQPTNQETSDSSEQPPNRAINLSQSKIVINYN